MEFTTITEWPEDVVLIVKGALKSGLYRETEERKLQILNTMNGYLCKHYGIEPVPTVSVVTTVNNEPIPQGGSLVLAENKILLDKISLVSYLSHFAKVLMFKRVAGWEGDTPDLMFPMKFSHSLFHKVAPIMYGKALAAGRLMLPPQDPPTGGKPPPPPA